MLFQNIFFLICAIRGGTGSRKPHIAKVYLVKSLKCKGVLCNDCKEKKVKLCSLGLSSYSSEACKPISKTVTSFLFINWILPVRHLPSSHKKGNKTKSVESSVNILIQHNQPLGAFTTHWSRLFHYLHADGDTPKSQWRSLEVWYSPVFPSDAHRGLKNKWDCGLDYSRYRAYQNQAHSSMTPAEERSRFLI